MRRALLTAGSVVPSGPPTIGQNPVTNGANTSGQGVLNVDIVDAATSSGTITTAKAALVAGGGTFRIIIGTLSGTTFTVKQSTANLTSAVGGGIQTFAVNLPVDAGDLIGLWASTSGAVPRSVGGGTSSAWKSTGAPSGAITGMTIDTSKGTPCVGSPG